MDKELYTVIILNSPQCSPRYCPEYNLILLNAEYSCWNQVAFQMAHELTHYAIRQHTKIQFEYKDSYCAVGAFEEPVCEAMAFYILKSCAEQWHECELNIINPGYAPFFVKYLVNMYTGVGETNLYDSYDKWKKLCAVYSSEYTPSKRPDVSAMRNHLFDTFIKMPHEIKNIIEYPMYLDKEPYDKLIDVERWVEIKPSSAEFIKTICSIQPTKPVVDTNPDNTIGN